MSMMHTRIGKIRKMIENYLKDPKRRPNDYHAFLAKCSRLDELDIRLNELESMEPPEDKEEASLFEDEITEIGDEVRKLTSFLEG